MLSFVKKRLRLKPQPPLGQIDFGNLRRVTPISQVFGFDRGKCVDRYYIESYLGLQTDDIQRDVLEIGDDTYTRKFGANRVDNSEVLHIWQDNQKATMVADLTNGENIPSNTFNCIILTQTLSHIYDVKAALRTLIRILKPGGVLLATMPGISQISRYDMDRWGDYWRFTTLSARRLFEEVFPASNVTVKAYGNVLTAIAFLHGLAAEELNQEELDYSDPDYEVLIAVRAEKPAAIDEDS